jgi:hypothetical protein
MAGCAEMPKKTSDNLDADMARMMTWFTGEFDNYEQVWQQEVDGLKKEDRHEHIHHIFKPVNAPNIGDTMFFVKQFTDGDYENVYRQRLYKFHKNLAENAIQLTIYSYLDEAKYRNGDQTPEMFENITAEELKTTAGCEVFWRFNGEYFDGVMKENGCFFFSKRSGKKITITDTLRLTDSEIWIGDKAYDEQGQKVFGRDIQHKNRKVRYFEGWMGMAKNKVIADANDKDWFFDSKVRIHNEGQIIALKDKAGEKTGYSIQLAQLTYQNTTHPILKLGLIEDATGKTVTYIWSETDTSNIGMNLRWFQVGLTAEE